jgi:hypothetical protein
MNTSEALQNPGVVPARPPRRAGRTIAYALLTAAGGIAATIVCGAVLWPKLFVTDHPMSFAQRAWLITQSAIVSGFLIGAAQWVLIRRWMRGLLAGAVDRLPERGRRVIRESAWWIVATTGGHLIGGGLEGLLLSTTYSSYSSRTEHFFLTMLSGALHGALLGTAQWVYLRRYVSRAGRWIRISAVGYLVATALVHLIPSTLAPIDQQLYEAHPILLHVIFCLLSGFMGLVFGAFQGWGLVHLKPLPEYGGEPDAGRGARPRGWPADRGARVRLVAGLILFVIGPILPPVVDTGAYGGIYLIVKTIPIYEEPYLILGMFIGLLLIPFSIRVARYSHAWAIAISAVGGLVSLIPIVVMLNLFSRGKGYTFSTSVFPVDIFCWNLSGLLMTAGWIVAYRRARRMAAAPPTGGGRRTTPGEDDALPP